MTTKSDRLSAFTRQIARLENRLTRLYAASSRLATLRLLTAAVGLPLTIAAFFSTSPALFWLAMITTVAAFTVLVALHRRIKRQIDAHTVWLDIKHAHVARMNLDWPRIPPARLPFQEMHPLEVDLDLPALHRLIDTATTDSGSRLLRQWLLTLAPDADTIARRQALIHELIPMTIFRTRLTLRAVLAARDYPRGRHGQALLDWLNHRADAEILHPTPVILAVILSAATILLAVLASRGTMPPLWIATWLVYAGLSLNQWPYIRALFGDSLTLADELRRIGAVMDYLESYPYRQDSHLRALCAPILESRPSRFLRRVSWIAGAAGLRQNPILWPLVNAIIPWDLVFAYLLNRHQAVLAEHLPLWLEVWHELEALSSLANFAHLNPGYTFPTISADAVFTAQAIGHPLIPDESRVCNDFAFGQPGELVIITGSNMAGKSSFLRTLGINLCLAYAGGPVSAQALETRLFRLFSSIRLSDSLDDGISYFYAEVKRLKALLDALRQDDDLPLFFVIDEIFRGTNNRERLIGSRSYTQALVGENGVGLIATHDLELVKLADNQPAIRNYHFREEIHDGRMKFDYTLRPGPCPTTNALRIMAMAGLPVEKSE